MNAKIKREMKGKKYLYKMDFFCSLIGEANYTYGFIPRKIHRLSTMLMEVIVVARGWNTRTARPMQSAGSAFGTRNHYICVFNRSRDWI